MNWSSIAFDWNLVRAFLVTAEEGSFSAAARALGLTQPTLGRQVAGLEDALGVILFERLGRSLALTQSGLELLDHVRAMGEAANQVSLTASGQSQSIEGQVSISATDLMAIYFLPDILQKLRNDAPGISVEIIASNALSDLRRREADIALRHVRPSQPDLIAKLVQETDVHLYAATSYLETHGRPATLEDLKDATFVGFDPDSMEVIQALNTAGISIGKDAFKFYSASGVVAWDLVRQGFGISVMGADIAERTPGIECLFPDHPIITVPTWLVTHRELHTSRRIRLVFDHLAESL